MIDNKKYVELIWEGKYDKYEKGGKIPIERPNLPFQVVETINDPRLKEYEDTFGKEFYSKSVYPLKTLSQRLEKSSHLGR